MTKSELLELIANGENSGVEFKRDDLRPEQLAKEVVALANFQGGRILLGVDDDGTITGIQRADLERWVMDTVFGRYVHPMIIPFYEEVQADETASGCGDHRQPGRHQTVCRPEQGSRRHLYPGWQHVPVGNARATGAAVCPGRHAAYGIVTGVR